MGTSAYTIMKRERENYAEKGENPTIMKNQ